MRITTTADVSWRAVLEGLTKTLRQKGLEAQRTFDLQLARQSLRSNEAAPCPHHGAAPCSCQYLVLQIGGPGRPPSAIVIHGHDRTTMVSFVPDGDSEMAQEIAAAVYEALDCAQTPHDPGHQRGGRNAGESKARRSAGAQGQGSRM